MSGWKFYQGNTMTEQVGATDSDSLGWSENVAEALCMLHGAAFIDNSGNVTGLGSFELPKHVAEAVCMLDRAAFIDTIGGDVGLVVAVAIWCCKLGGPIPEDDCCELISALNAVAAKVLRQEVLAGLDTVGCTPKGIINALSVASAVVHSLPRDVDSALLAKWQESGIAHRNQIV